MLTTNILAKNHRGILESSAQAYSKKEFVSSSIASKTFCIVGKHYICLIRPLLPYVLTSLFPIICFVLFC
jgi:hypothetical protein